MTYETVRVLEQISKEMARNRARCSKYCSKWNSEDRDCEIYGDNHPSPSRCQVFLETEARKRMIGGKDD
ncbi:MAG: hypothetical protein K2I95_10420 [Treponemataceae bacterium]|nr:hypothetical protein [Treponemataceae bacterium]